MSEKEKQAMNGECKSYRMNDPIAWEEFKEWPKEHQETYIKLLRKKFNVPIGEISKMFGLHRTYLSTYITSNKLKVDKSPRGPQVWDKEGFLAWCGGAKDGVVQHSETPVEEDELVAVNEEADINVPEEDADQLLKETEELENESEENNSNESSCETNIVIPESGEMTFKGNVDDILRTISKLLDGRRVKLEVEWEVL
jgi:hypothetical protein